MSIAFNDNKASLKVAEANTRDVGRRIARIDPKVAESLGISTGDAIEVHLLTKERRQFLAGLLIRLIMGKVLSALMAIPEAGLA